MRVWLSEFTHLRLERYAQMKLPPILTDDRGYKLVDLPEKTVVQAELKFPGNVDSAINFAISHSERVNRMRRKALGEGALGEGPEAA